MNRVLFHQNMGFVNDEELLEKAKLFYDFIGVIVVVINQNGDIELINQKGLETLGYMEEELVGKSWLETCIPEDSRERLGTLHQRVFQDEMDPIEIMESAVLRKSGDERIISWHNVGVRDGDGKYKYILKSGYDITEQLFIRRQLKLNEEYNRSIVRAIPDTIVRFNQEGVFLDVITNDNKKLKILDTSPYKIIGKSLVEVFSPPVAQDIATKINEVIFNGRLQILEFKHAVNGIESFFELRIIYAGNGEILGVFRDITENKRNQEAIRRYAEQLKSNNLEISQLYDRLNEEIKKGKAIHELTMRINVSRAPGLAVAKYYQPAELIGGDFYDLIQKEDKVIMYISDVTGHGLDGAFLSTFVKNAIDSYVSFHHAKEITAGGILQYISSRFRNSNYPEDLFISIFLCIYDLQTKELAYCGAGFQESPLLYLGDGKTKKLVSKGLPISLAIPKELQVCEEKHTYLPPNSTLLIYSDGLAEQWAEGKEFRNILEESFYSYCHLSADDIVKNINREFFSFNGSYQGDDDITFLVIKTLKEEQKNEHIYS